MNDSSVFSDLAKLLQRLDDSQTVMMSPMRQFYLSGPLGLIRLRWLFQIDKQLDEQIRMAFERLSLERQRD